MNKMEYLNIQFVNQNIYIPTKEIPSTSLYKGNKSGQMTSKFIIFGTNDENIVNWAEAYGSES